MSHNFFMQRCFDIARKGEGNVSPNPMVGAVIVHENRILGEGYHEEYGKAHAEVNAVASVAKADLKLLSESTIYVSLEPCCVYGNTPPCTELILKHKIPHVVISYIDKSLGDNGKSVHLLREKGIKVTTGILEAEGKILSEVRDTYTQKQRPYVVLKYAVSRNGFMAKKDEQIWLSNSYSKRLVHKWRSEIGAILAGTNTLKIDNPQLNNRLYFGGQPLRICLDRRLELPKNASVLDDSADTIIVTEKKSLISDETAILTLDFDGNLLRNILDYLHQQKINSVLIEGGAKTIDYFIKENLWDEIRVLQTDRVIESAGIASPQLTAPLVRKLQIDTDELLIYRNAS